MWKYPDGTFRQNPPARVEHAGYIRNFADLTRAERDGIGYNEAVPIRREPFTAYETEWTKDADLVYRETVISAVVDEAARDEAKADAIRSDRDQLLADSDWTQLPNAPLTPTSVRAWAVYRDALRDITEQDGFPDTVDWPVEPDVSSDTDLATAANMAVVTKVSEEDALKEIGQLVDSMEDGVAKATLQKLITILGE